MPVLFGEEFVSHNKRTWQDKQDNHTVPQLSTQFDFVVLTVNFANAS